MPAIIDWCLKKNAVVQCMQSNSTIPNFRIRVFDFCTLHKRNNAPFHAVLTCSTVPGMIQRHITIISINKSISSIWTGHHTLTTIRVIVGRVVTTCVYKIDDMMLS